MFINKKAGLIENVMADEAIVVDIRRKMLYTFNSSAGVLWSLLKKKPLSLEFLIGQYRRRLGLPKDDARKDVCKFVRQLAKRHLVSMEESHGV